MLSKTRIYYVWSAMKERCHRRKNKSFHNYGGRGIKVCDRWNNSFSDFLEDMGTGKKGWSIERVNNDGDYEPSNICWATAKRQSRNMRANRTVTVRGVTGCLIEICEMFGTNYNTTRNRIYRGWEVERAFFEPQHRF